MYRVSVQKRGIFRRGGGCYSVDSLAPLIGSGLELSLPSNARVTCFGEGVPNGAGDFQRIGYHNDDGADEKNIVFDFPVSEIEHVLSLWL